MQLLLGITFVCVLALLFSFLLNNQQKSIQSTKRIEMKLDKLLTLLTKEKNNE
jgi:low affinity Fe/Cu permease